MNGAGIERWELLKSPPTRETVQLRFKTELLRHKAATDKPIVSLNYPQPILLLV